MDAPLLRCKMEHRLAKRNEVEVRVGVVVVYFMNYVANQLVCALQLFDFN
jgi:hypothetical protein